MHTGGCLCGAVRYRISGEIRDVWLCHCRQCRKAQGSAFAASVPTPREQFELTHGAETLRAYRASPHKRRWFCGKCGSPIYSEVDAGPVLRLRAGSLDEPVTLTPVGHIFVADKAAWDCIQDDLPQHAGREPGR